MRIVGLPADHVDADTMALLEAGEVVDVTLDDALPEHLARELAAEVLPGPRVMAGVDPVDALVEVRDPTDPALRERDAQVGELPQHGRPQEVRRRLDDVDRLEA